MQEQKLTMNEPKKVWTGDQALRFQLIFSPGGCACRARNRATVARQMEVQRTGKPRMKKPGKPGFSQKECP
jgi:hypothetical protein